MKVERMERGPRKNKWSGKRERKKWEEGENKKSGKRENGETVKRMKRMGKKRRQ